MAYETDWTMIFGNNTQIPVDAPTLLAMVTDAESWVDMLRLAYQPGTFATMTIRPEDRPAEQIRVLRPCDTRGDSTFADPLGTP